MDATAIAFDPLAPSLVATEPSTPEAQDSQSTPRTPSAIRALDDCIMHKGNNSDNDSDSGFPGDAIPSDCATMGSSQPATHSPSTPVGALGLLFDNTEAAGDLSVLSEATRTPVRASSVRGGGGGDGEKLPALVIGDEEADITFPAFASDGNFTCFARADAISPVPTVLPIPASLVSGNGENGEVPSSHPTKPDPLESVNNLLDSINETVRKTTEEAHNALADPGNFQTGLLLLVRAKAASRLACQARNEAILIARTQVQLSHLVNVYRDLANTGRHEGEEAPQRVYRDEDEEMVGGDV